MLNSLREDYAQDRKELDYLDIERDKKQPGFEKALADQRGEIAKVFNKLCDTLNKLFEPFGFYLKDANKYWYDEGKKVLCFKNKDDDREYELYEFNVRSLYESSFYDRGVKDDYLNRYKSFRKKVLGSVIARVMDGLHGQGDKYYPIEAEDFASYKDGISKLEKLTSDFQSQVLPLFKEAADKINVEYKISASRIDRDSNVIKARDKARKSYLKENPIAPGMVVIWNLQNGDAEDVEVISVDETDQTAKVKTDGGAVRKVPLSRLEVDTVRAGIDKKYY